MSTKPLDITPAIDPNGAVRSFFKDPTWRVKAGIGATFNCCSILLLALNPMLLPLSVLLWALVCGYMLKVIRVKIKDPDAPLPEWRDWVDLLISGLTWLAVYTGALFLVMSVLTMAMIFGAIQGSIYAPDPRFVPFAVSTLTAVFISWLLVGIITTYTQANFAEEERMPAAFALRKLFNLFKRHGGTMLQVWLMVVGLNAAAVIVPPCTIIGIAFLPMTTFIAGTISATMVAQAWRAIQN